MNMFVHVGFGNIVNSEKVIALVRPDTSSGRRYLKSAKKSGTYIDVARGRALKSLLLINDGKVMGAAISTKTLMKRFNGVDNDVDDEDDDVEEVLQEDSSEDSVDLEFEEIFEEVSDEDC